MSFDTACKACRSHDFLGIECAWPAPQCLGAPRTRPHARLRRGLRATALAVALALALSGVWQLGHAGYIQAKAWLAQSLIRDAWARVQAGEAQAKPWPWADTWPVARLRAPAQDIDRMVLAGADGRTMAFGPGHLYGTPLPGEPGNSVVGAHRDTHFAFLQWIQDGDLIEIETARGRLVRYRVVERAVVDRRDTGLIGRAVGDRELTLVTCYPFDALRAGGDSRFLVRAVADDEAGKSRL
ncbi:MAG: class GN sortase [Rhodocyclaceae bacterium]|nr:class GN sortase [Rhodocyclaceae bacterium]